MAYALNTYCPLAFREIYMDSAGDYRLCCHSSSSNQISQFNINNATPFEFFRSVEMENVRNNMLEGKPIQGCEVCYEMELNDNQSFRQMRYIPKYSYPTDVDQINLKLRMFGSYCNLSCYMCIPYNSTTRRNELEKIYGQDYKKIDGFGKEVNIIKSDHWDRCLNDILENISLVKHIHFTGGEPLQLPKHWELVNKIPYEHAKNICLVYDTNLTDLTWKNNSIFDLQNKFEKIELEVSCDHFGDKLAWIRYPIDVKNFEENLKTAKHIIKKISLTVSILNIYDLESIIDYYSRFEIKVDLTNVVRYPPMLSIKNLPDDYKNKYFDMYKDVPIINQELLKPRIDQEYRQGLTYCQQLSNHRGFDYKKLWTSL